MWRAFDNAGGASEIVRIPGRQILEMVGQESDPLEPRRVEDRWFC